MNVLLRCFKVAFEKRALQRSFCLLRTQHLTRRSNITGTAQVMFCSQSASRVSTSLSPSFLSTESEPRIPKQHCEVLARIQPLADHLQVDPKFLIRLGDENHMLSPLTPVLSKKQLLSVLELPLQGESGFGDHSEVLSGLSLVANSLCTKYHGDKVHYRGLLEFSNICRNDCFYCGIRKSFHVMKRYVLDEETILDIARWSADQGYGSIMLQSGEVQTRKWLDFLCKVIRRIVDETELGISLSVGELPDEYYEKLKEAGAKRYLLRIETSSPELFARIHPPNQTFESRYNRLRALRKIGFMVGTGVMIGLPGQTRADLAEDLLFFLREDVDMIGMGPYILKRGTPTGTDWENENPAVFQAVMAKETGNATPEQLQLLDAYNAKLFELTMRMIALSRILLGDVNIAATTALQTIHPTGREVALMRGANILMPILTPKSQRANYQLYEGKVCIDESAKQCRACMELRVAAAGKRIAYGEQGDPPHALRRMKHPVTQ